MSLHDIEERIDYYRIRAWRQGRAHYLAAKRSSRLNNWLGIPVVTSTTIVGTTIFSTLNSQPILWLRIITGLLSVGAAVLSALQTFFKYAERAEKHYHAGAALFRIKRNFDIFLLNLAEAQEKDRAALLEKLAALASEFDQIEKESPDVPDELYDRAKREQMRDTEGI